MPRVKIFCEPNRLDYTVENRSERSIRNAINCAKAALPLDNTDSLHKALAFIYHYLRDENRFPQDTDLLGELTDLIYKKIDVWRPLDENAVKIMRDLSNILASLARGPYDLYKNSLVTGLLNSFQTRLAQTSDYLKIKEANDFLHRFRLLFQDYGNRLLVDPNAIEGFFHQFQAMSVDLKLTIDSKFSYAKGVILDLYGSLSYSLDNYQEKNPGTDRRVIFDLTNAVYKEAFNLVKQDKKEFYLRVVLSKWRGNNTAALAECKKHPYFCEIITKEDVLPHKKTWAVNSEFRATFHYAGALDERTLAAVLNKGYKAIEAVYDPVFGENSFKNKTFQPEIFIFPDQATYIKYGYELFGFQTDNGGQEFTSAIEDPHSCSFAIFLTSKNNQVNPFFNLVHELGHCYEGAASLQSGIGDVNLLPPSIRESVPQLIQNLVLAEAGDDSFERLTLGALKTKVMEFAAQLTVQQKSTLFADILSQSGRDIDNYYRATLLAAYLVENGHLKEFMACTEGNKKNVGATNRCFVDFAQRHNTKFLNFLDTKIIPLAKISLEISTMPTRPRVQLTSSWPKSTTLNNLIKAIEAQNERQIDALLSGNEVTQVVNAQQIPSGNTPLHVAIARWQALKIKNTEPNAITDSKKIIWVLFNKGAELKGLVNADGKSPFDLIQEAEDKEMMETWAADAKKNRENKTFSTSSTTTTAPTIVKLPQITPITVSAIPMISVTTASNLNSSPRIRSASTLITTPFHKFKASHPTISGINDDTGTVSSTAISTQVKYHPSVSEKILAGLMVGAGQALFRALCDVAEKRNPQWSKSRCKRWALKTARIAGSAIINSFHAYALSYPSQLGIKPEGDLLSSMLVYGSANLFLEISSLLLSEAIQYGSRVNNTCLRMLLPGFSILNEGSISLFKKIVPYLFVIYPWFMLAFGKNQDEKELLENFYSLLANTLVSIVVYGGTQFIAAKIFEKTAKNQFDKEEEKELIDRSTPDSLGIKPLIVRLEKSLTFFKKSPVYDWVLKDKLEALNTNYICEYKKSIDILEDIKKSLSNELLKLDKKNASKIKHVKMIIDSLVQRFNLLALPGISSENSPADREYLTKQLESGFQQTIKAIQMAVDSIRQRFEEKAIVGAFDELITVETAIYDVNFLVHAEGYYKNYELKQVRACLKPTTEAALDTLPRSADGWAGVKKFLHNDVLATMGHTLQVISRLETKIVSFKNGKDKDELLVAINSIKQPLASIEKQTTIHINVEQAKAKHSDTCFEYERGIDSAPPPLPSVSFFREKETNKKRNTWATSSYRVSFR